MKKRGFTLIEIAVAIGIVSVLMAIILVNYNLYEARYAARSAAQVLVSDMKMQQQRAFALEENQGITICPAVIPGPDGNTNEYRVWKSSPGNVVRRVDFNNIFRANVRFGPGQGGTEIRFYPSTSTAEDEWGVYQSNRSEVSQVFIYGGDTLCTINIVEDGRFTIDEQIISP